MWVSQEYALAWPFPCISRWEPHVTTGTSVSAYLAVVYGNLYHWWILYKHVNSKYLCYRSKQSFLYRPCWPDFYVAVDHSLPAASQCQQTWYPRRNRAMASSRRGHEQLETLDWIFNTLATWNSWVYKPDPSITLVVTSCSRLRKD
jgi:hypothetical protein